MTSDSPPDATANAARLDLVGELDRYLFNEGRHHRLYECLGGHLLDGATGAARFAVWAPNATSVSVVHDGNGWRAGVDRLEPQASSGIWAGVVGGVDVGTRYKYALDTPRGRREKADPVAFACEAPPGTASVLTRLDYAWGDASWVARRAEIQGDRSPVSVYEVHLGSWRRRADGSSLTYEQAGTELAEYVTHMGFTHVELLPVMEHPFYGSWGYQTTGFFTPTARFGPPSGLMELVDVLHSAGIGVLLDWVPSHFATDSFALGDFDGTHLYEHAEPGRAIHPDWGSFVFNYGRHEVRSFLTSSACFWLDRYHADGLRVDAVASMLYLDYSRSDGEWTPNRFGGREDLDAIEFLREMNDAVHDGFPGVLTIAEESTAWPGVTRASASGGLGFSLKWDMGWMHDTLAHLRRDAAHRRYHYEELTFRALYAGSERYLLPLSHDEVVHGKGSLAAKMPGDDWQRRANLRLLYGYQWLLPGKKLLFMGDELATWKEWDHESEIEWSLLDHPAHAGVARFVADCNRCYRTHEALHGRELDSGGFTWIVADAPADGVLAWLRTGHSGEAVVAIANFTPVPRTRRIGVPAAGWWREVLNSDASSYGGSGVGNLGGLAAAAQPWDGQAASLECAIPPLGIVALAGRAW
ncbi:MAG TPA: 1,4-alpha-glucan branching protein GlgB [Acidimicrobiales bacterium]|nr:1,4-alpha-glucan branching protein GlgB [Acidimicrobiales bacterium]